MVARRQDDGVLRQRVPEELDPKPPAKDDKTEKPRQSDVRVITRAVYRSNGVPGSGFVDPDRPSHLWTVAVPVEPFAAAAKPKRITSGEFSAGNHRWSNDGTQIYFTADRRSESYYLSSDNDLYAVNRDGGEPVRLVSIEGNLGAYAQSPDGKRMAFVGTFNGSPERSFSQPDLWVVDLPSGTPRNLTEKYDFDINGGLGGDQRAPRGGAPAAPYWTRDGRAILIRVGEQGDANVVRIDLASGRMDPVIKGRHDVMSYTADDAATTIAFVKSTSSIVGDLYVHAGGSEKKLTGFNDDLFNGLTITEPEEIWYTSFDGKKIQGWILKPPAFDPAKRIR